MTRARYHLTALGVDTEIEKLDTARTPLENADATGQATAASASAAAASLSEIAAAASAASLGGIPALPGAGATYTLKSIANVLTWVVDA